MVSQDRRHLFETTPCLSPFEFLYLLSEARPQRHEEMVRAMAVLLWPEDESRELISRLSHLSSHLPFCYSRFLPHCLLVHASSLIKYRSVTESVHIGLFDFLCALSSIVMNLL